VAVSVGLVIARSERGRRRARRRAREQRLGLQTGEPLAPGLRRMALGQVELALEQLGASARGTSQAGGTGRAGGTSRAGGTWAGGVPDQKAVHETRKAIKRLRALLRVLREELGERGYEREDAALRDIARQLSGARDAAVMLATLDALVKRHPRELGRRRGVLALRRRLAAESTRVQRLTLADAAARGEVMGELHALRWRVTAWSLPEEEGMRLIDADLEWLYRQGRRRRRRVLGGHGERTLAMHRWRKRVKDLRYVAEMLERVDSRGSGHAPLRKLAAAADDLGEVLGEDHDLAVLAQHLREGARGGRPGHGVALGRGRELWRTKPGTRKALLRLIAKRRRKLRRRALRRGERLYARRPQRFMRDVRSAYADAALS
jgi:CHAD domain-containing protein